MSKSDNSMDFEKKLAELEALVTRLENGDLSLEESLQAYESGIRLTRECQKMLDQAQLRIETATSELSAPQTESRDQ